MPKVEIKNENRYNIINHNDNKLNFSENVIDMNNNQNSKKPDNNLEKNNDEFKEFLISENTKLKKEVKNYENLIWPFINYINEINRK